MNRLRSITSSSATQLFLRPLCVVYITSRCSRNKRPPALPTPNKTGTVEAAESEPIKRFAWQVPGLKDSSLVWSKRKILG